MGLKDYTKIKITKIYIYIYIYIGSYNTRVYMKWFPHEIDHEITDILMYLIYPMWGE